MSQLWNIIHRKKICLKSITKFENPQTHNKQHLTGVIHQAKWWHVWEHCKETSPYVSHKIRIVQMRRRRASLIKLFLAVMKKKKKHTHKHALSQTHTFIFTDSYDVLKTSCDSRRWKKPFRSRLNQPQNIKSKKSTQNAPQTAEQWGRRWGEECDLAGLFWNLILEKKERKKKKPLLHPSTHSPLQQCGTPS